MSISKIEIQNSIDRLDALMEAYRQLSEKHKECVPMFFYSKGKRDTYQLLLGKDSMGYDRRIFELDTHNREVLIKQTIESYNSRTNDVHMACVHKKHPYCVDSWCIYWEDYNQRRMLCALDKE